MQFNSAPPSTSELHLKWRRVFDVRRKVILIDNDVRGEGEVVHQATVGLQHRVRRFDLFNVIASLALTVLGQPVSWFVFTLGS